MPGGDGARRGFARRSTAVGPARRNSGCRAPRRIPARRARDPGRVLDPRALPVSLPAGSPLLLVDPFDHLGDRLQDLLLVERDLVDRIDHLKVLGRCRSSAAGGAVGASTGAVAARHPRAVVVGDRLQYGNDRDRQRPSLKNATCRLPGHGATSVSNSISTGTPYVPVTRIEPIPAPNHASIDWTNVGLRRRR